MNSRVSYILILLVAIVMVNILTINDLVFADKEGALTIITQDNIGNMLGNVTFTLDGEEESTEDDGSITLQVTANRIHKIIFGTVEGFNIETPSSGMKFVFIRNNKDKEVKGIYSSLDNKGGIETDCDTLLSVHISNLDFIRPSWEELSCFTDDLERLPVPTFAKRILAGAELGIQSNLVELNINYWDELIAKYPINVSPANMPAMPPYVDNNGNNLKYPLDSETLDDALRSIATVLINEKLKGMVVLLANIYPVDDTDIGLNSEEEFRNWFTDVFIPEKTAEAIVAERIKAEYYVPFPIEFELFIKRQFGFIETLSDAKKLALAQDLLDEAFNTVRPLFNGRLVAYSFNRYEDTDDFWSGLVFSKFDEVGFTLFPECDLVGTDDRLELQFFHIMKIVERDNIPWSIGELQVLEELFAACDNSGETFKSLQADIYSSVFNKVTELPIQPIGMHIGDVLEAHTDEAQAVVLEFFNSH